MLERKVREELMAIPTRWYCSYCGSTYAEYVNGCPRCHLGESGTSTAVKMSRVVPEHQFIALLAAAEAEERLRELLAVAHAGAGLYVDDGELQDNTANPAIDFKRDSVSDIVWKLEERARFAALTQPPAESEAGG